MSRKIIIDKYRGNTHYSVYVVDSYKTEHHLGYYRDLPSDKGEVVHHRDGTTGCYVKDPDGNVVEFIYYSDKMRADIGIDK